MDNWRTSAVAIALCSLPGRMPKPRDPLIVITFKGPRFEDHGIDVRDLSALIAVRSALVRYAEDLWREEHEGKPPPKTFADTIQLRIYGIDEGSAALAFYDESIDVEPAEPADKQLVLIPQADKKRRTAQQRNKEAARRVSRAASGKDENVPDDVLSSLRRLTTSLSSDDDYVIDVPEIIQEIPAAPTLALVPATPTQSPANDRQQERVSTEDAESAHVADVAARIDSYHAWSHGSSSPDDTEGSKPSSRPVSIVTPAPDESVVLDKSARQRLAQVIADRKPPKPSPDIVEEDVMVEGELYRAVVATERGGTVSVDFAHEVEAHFVGRGVRDPRTKRLRITQYTIVKPQLDLFDAPGTSPAPTDGTSPAPTDGDDRNKDDDSAVEALTITHHDTIIQDMRAEMSVEDAVALIADPRGPFAGKSAAVRDAVREALLDAESYAGDVESDMSALLVELRAAAEARGLLFDDDDDDGERGDGEPS